MKIQKNKFYDEKQKQQQKMPKKVYKNIKSRGGSGAAETSKTSSIYWFYLLQNHVDTSIKLK